MSTVQCSEIGTPRHRPSRQLERIQYLSALTLRQRSANEPTVRYSAVGSMRSSAPSSSSVTT